MHLTFNKPAVKALLTHALTSEHRTPAMEHLLDPQYLKHPLPPGQEFAELKDIDQSKLPAGLLLVGDHGMYLLSNGSNDDETTRHVEYAHEGNPDTNPDWYDTKLDTTGGDDSVDFLDAQLVRKWLTSTNKNTLTITFEGDSMRFH